MISYSELLKCFANYRLNSAFRYSCAIALTSVGVECRFLLYISLGIFAYHEHDSPKSIESMESYPLASAPCLMLPITLTNAMSAQIAWSSQKCVGCSSGTQGASWSYITFASPRSCPGIYLNNECPI